MNSQAFLSADTRAAVDRQAVLSPIELLLAKAALHLRSVIWMDRHFYLLSDDFRQRMVKGLFPVPNSVHEKSRWSTVRCTAVQVPGQQLELEMVTLRAAVQLVGLHTVEEQE